MNLQHLISSYVRYNQWANQTTTTWLRTLDSKTLYRQTPSSFGSIDLTLQHMVHAQNFWFAIIGDGREAVMDETIRVNEADAVMNDLVAGSKKMVDRYLAYPEAALIEPIHSRDLTQCRYEFIMHVVNHNSYHRGQLVTMARALGAVNGVPNTDYEGFLWDEKNRK